MNYETDEIKGRVFSGDLKSSFLGYFIEFKNEDSSFKTPLKIDGTFKLKISAQKYDINIYDKDALVKLDLKSPDYINDGNIHIPYLDGEFDYKNDLDLKQLLNHYSKLLKEIDYLNEYLSFDESEIQKYIETLLEIAQRDRIALNQAKIYIDYLDEKVNMSKEDLEFSILLENVSNKIEVVKNNGLFEIEDIDEISKTRDLDKLRQYHRSMIEKYVSLNKNDVIEECFFNLKLEGIYTNNEKLAGELIEKAHAALNGKDYDELLNIVNLLYELDERLIK